MPYPRGASSTASAECQYSARLALTSASCALRSPSSAPARRAVLAHLLHRRGIESVVLERASRDYVEQRVRAGVLEQGTVDLLVAAGVGERLQREGLVHHGIELRFDGRRHRIALSELTGGRAITVYGQQEVVKDLIAARLAAGGQICFEAERRGVRRARRRRSRACASARRTASDELRMRLHRRLRRLPRRLPRRRSRRARCASTSSEYPFAWLGILAATPPSQRRADLRLPRARLRAAQHALARVSRLYLQCAPDEELDDWPDERIWEELQRPPRDRRRLAR